MTHPEQMALDNSIAILHWEILELLWSLKDKALYDAEIVRLMNHKDELEKKADAA